MQGFPDPYSGLATGLTQGVQAGGNIMQMVYQKAQAKLDASTKSMALNLGIAANKDLPMSMRVEGAQKYADEISIQNKGEKKTITIDDFTPEKTKAYGRMNKILSDPDLSQADKIKAIKGIAFESGFTPEETKPMTSGLEQGIRTEEWNGTQATEGLANIPAQQFGPLNMGEIPGYSGAQAKPGIGASFSGLSTDRKEMVKQNYLAGEKFNTGDLPTGEKPDEWADWGHGQKRNKTTGEIKKVPVAPKDGEGGSFKTAKDLRSEFISQSKNYMDVRDSYARIQASSKDPSPAGDVAVIFSYMRMLDPASTVREGEFATASNTGSVPQRVSAQYNKALTGERLADSMRTDFITNAQKLYKRQEIQHAGRTKEYKRLAKEFGINPDTVIVDFSDPSNVAIRGNKFDKFMK